MSILSTLERQKIYDEVRRLKQLDPEVDIHTVKRELASRFPILPSRMTLRRWLDGKTSPTSSMNKFDPMPSEALSFFLGAWIGDGWGDVNDGGRRLLLRVRCRDFAAEFARAASVILQKEKPYTARRVNRKDGVWYVVKVTSLLLYEFSNQPLSHLRRFIDPCPLGFLRGIYTAEGCPSVSISIRRSRLDVSIVVSNSDLSLLEYVRMLLLRLGFHPEGARLNYSIGERTNLSTATRDGWLVSMTRINDVQDFAATIGFADPAKMEKLNDALSLLITLGPFAAVEEWKKAYTKTRHTWIKNSTSAS